MWLKPGWITDPIADKLWSVCTDHLPFPKLVLQGTSDDTTDIVLAWVDRVEGMVNRHAARFVHPSLEPTPISFRREFGTWLAGEVTKLERRRRYDLVPRTNLRVSEMAIQTLPQSQAVSAIMMFVMTGFTALLGTEKRMLVGTRDGTPTWKRIRRVTTREDAELFAHQAYQACGTYMSELRPGDEWLVPEFREWDVDILEGHVYDQSYRDINHRLIENAFYNQRYLIDPEGVEVRVTDAGNIEKIWLKVRSSRKAGLVEILARLESAKGAYLMIVNEANLLGEKEQLQGSYPMYVVCQIYHDLVTAEEIPVHHPDTPGPVRIPGAPQDHQPGWIVIPRKVEVGYKPPRTKLPQPTTSDPQRVTGHKRRAKMTLAHREEILQFEKKWGVEILRFIPEGYTFVRPYMKPELSPEEFAALPRFIRYRVQQELEKLMIDAPQRATG